MGRGRRGPVEAAVDRMLGEQGGGESQYFEWWPGEWEEIPLGEIVAAARRLGPGYAVYGSTGFAGGDAGVAILARSREEAVQILRARNPEALEDDPDAPHLWGATTGD